MGYAFSIRKYKKTYRTKQLIESFPWTIWGDAVKEILQTSPLPYDLVSELKEKRVNGIPTKITRYRIRYYTDCGKPQSNRKLWKI
ncbi:hypothetical protein AN960_13140 [Bacillus sp. FJAT-25509]|nr:hypothetical protein AN960_13140 [Bacillus sp. FJAT-25509]